MQTLDRSVRSQPQPAGHDESGGMRRILLWLSVFCGCALAHRAEAQDACTGTGGYTDLRFCNAVWNVVTSSTDTITYRVENNDANSHTYTLTCSFGAMVTSCSTSPTSVTVPAGGLSAVLKLIYAVGATAGTGSVSYAASTSGDQVISTEVLSVATKGIGFSILNMDNQKLGLCATSCFGATVSHSSVSYHSLGADRAAWLLYNSERSTVRPVLAADVTIPTGSTLPTDITLQATVNGSSQRFLNGDVVVHFSTSGMTTGKTYRIAAQFDGSALATGMYSMTITAKTWNGGSSTSYTSSSKLMIVNLTNGYDLLPTKGWSVAGVQRAYRQTDGTVLLVEGDASGVYFGCVMNTGVTCTGPTGDFTKLYFDGNLYIRSYPDSTKVIFDNAGREIKSANRWGDTVVVSYSASNYVQQISDPMSRTAGLGFTYAGDSILIGTPGPNLQGSSSRPLRVRYNATSKRVTRFSDLGGGQTTLSYDAAGRLSSVTDRRGGVTTFGYDTTWHLASITMPSVPIDTGGGNTKDSTPVLRFRAWQTLVLPKTTTSSASGAPLIRADTAWSLSIGAVKDTSRFTADRWGQPLLTRDPLGNISTTVRTGLFATRVTDILGHVSNYVYSGPHLTSSSPFAQGTTTMSYDAWGMPNQITAPNQPTVQAAFVATPYPYFVRSIGGSSWYAYLDSRGRDTLDVDPLNHKHWTYYNATFGSADSVKVYDPTLVNSYTGSRTILDGYGRDSISRGTGAPVVTHLYDALGRDSLVYAYAGAQPTTFHYDSLFLTRVVDPKGQIFKTDYNALGWATAVYDAYDTTVKQVSYYDPAGRITRLRNRAGNDVANTYDIVGRLLTRQGFSTNDSVKYVYGYSVSGQLTSGLTETLGGSVIAADTIRAGYNGIDTVITWVAGKRFQRLHSKTANVAADTTTLTYTDANGNPVTGVPVNRRIRNWNAANGTLTSMVLGSTTISLAYDNNLQPTTLELTRFGGR